MNPPQSAYPESDAVHDECYTPPYAFDCLEPFVPKDSIVWESAAGGMYLAWTMMDRGYNVIATDIKRTGTNYFFYQPIFDIQITNPRFNSKYKAKWLRRACELGPFALLMQGYTLFPASTSELIDRYGLELVIPANGVRIDYFMPNGGYVESGAAFHSAWFTKGLNLPRQLNYVEIHKPRPAQVIAEVNRLAAKYGGQPVNQPVLPDQVMVKGGAIQDTLFGRLNCLD